LHRTLQWLSMAWAIRRRPLPGGAPAALRSRTTPWSNSDLHSACLCFLAACDIASLHIFSLDMRF
jgi:hypothetical protein